MAEIEQVGGTKFINGEPLSRLVDELGGPMMVHPRAMDQAFGSGVEASSEKSEGGLDVSDASLALEGVAAVTEALGQPEA